MSPRADMLRGMDAKATAWQYLKAQREAVLWKVEGLPERDQRMPLTPTGTNLLGVVKHLAVEAPGKFEVSDAATMLKQA